MGNAMMPTGLLEEGLKVASQGFVKTSNWVSKIQSYEYIQYRQAIS